MALGCSSIQRTSRQNFYKSRQYINDIFVEVTSNNIVVIFVFITPQTSPLATTSLAATTLTTPTKSITSFATTLTSKSITKSTTSSTSTTSFVSATSTTKQPKTTSAYINIDSPIHNCNSCRSDFKYEPNVHFIVFDDNNIPQIDEYIISTTKHLTTRIPSPPLEAAAAATTTTTTTTTLAAATKSSSVDSTSHKHSSSTNSKITTIYENTTSTYCNSTTTTSSSRTFTTSTTTSITTKPIKPTTLINIPYSIGGLASISYKRTQLPPPLILHNSNYNTNNYGSSNNAKQRRFRLNAPLQHHYSEDFLDSTVYYDDHVVAEDYIVSPTLLFNSRQQSNNNNNNNNNRSIKLQQLSSAKNRHLSCSAGLAGSLIGVANIAGFVDDVSLYGTPKEDFSPTKEPEMVSSFVKAERNVAG
ncbi:hypothetical protein HELRODRAFT_159614 [Helobdella robusta]|uniref:Uncharacterized protein n=1 Tax=Helobdella robusta TaxID=6412 RepID=T1EP88_HELRO|nr:hypothetical protein HELRODRAFT_159614 [Helobdella robusta]ESO13017.1 hypothetical protein HELRODRAFT_159614 [Helobdella robusta]